MDSEITKKTKCRTMECSNEVNQVKISREWTTPICDECIDKQWKKIEDERIQRQKRELNFRWNDLCPDIYRETDMNHPKVLQNSNEWDRVLNFQIQKVAKCGLLCIGSPGCGKSRAIWSLLKRIFFENKSKIRAYTETALAGQITRLFTIEPNKGVDLIEHLSQVGVLFIDDIGKSSVTDRFAQSLFEIIETRTSRMRPIIATANFDGNHLEKHLGDVGSPIVRRLREFCSVEVFK